MSMMKNPGTCQKDIILLQFGSDILALLCSDDSIQIFLISFQFSTFKTEANIKVPISHPQTAIKC